MNYGTYYEDLKNIVSSELRKRCMSDEYTSDYKRDCAKILLERGDITEEEFNQWEEKEDGKIRLEYERTVPKTLSECYGRDSVFDAIWNLSKSVEKVGGILFVILLIGGIIVSAMGSYVTQTTMEEVGPIFNQSYEEVTEKVFDGAIFLTNMVLWVIYAILEYWGFMFVSKLLVGLASIVQSNRITSNVALYMAKKRE